MPNRKTTLIVFVLLALLVSSCATRFGRLKKEPVDSAAVQMKAAVQAPVVPQLAKQPEQKRIDPCDALLKETVQKASTSKRTVKDVCDGLRIEATPMWSLDYDGTVHLRVHDQTGKLVRDEYMKP